LLTLPLEVAGFVVGIVMIFLLKLKFFVFGRLKKFPRDGPFSGYYYIVLLDKLAFPSLLFQGQLRSE